MTVSRGALLVRALAYLGAGLVLMGLLFFGLAGTLAYWQAWLYLGTLFVPITLALVYLIVRDPELLARRLRTRETRSEQRRIIGGTAYLILLAFFIPGLDRRFGWSSVPAAVVILADVTVVAAYGLFFLVMRENSYAARTIAVEAGQKVITTGPYRVVRHPMYVAAIVMYLASPLALGSVWAVLPALLLPFVLARRVRDEERLLSDELPGYREYQRTTKYRLVPGVW
jgi:protein-S-isoprenylcysteine O-methyltransferase Ste14